MPKKMTWGDAFASVVVPDTISYKLPPEQSIDRAPSHLVIDGFGTLEMQRTRVSVYGNESLTIIDEQRRTPLHAAVQRGRDPRTAHLGQLNAAGPEIGIGRGNVERDKGLYTTWQMVKFGAAMFVFGVGVVNLFVNPMVGAITAVAGFLGMAWVMSKAAYHIPDAKLAEGVADPNRAAAQAAA